MKDKSKKKYTIAITGLNAIDSPGPGIAVIRGLRESKKFDSRIVGLSYESLEPGIYMHDLVDKTYQIPYPSAGTGNLLERLKYINEKENIDIIIPNFDAELYSFIKLESPLKELGIGIFVPTLVQFEERHKFNLSEFGEKYKLDVPFSQPIYSAQEFYSLPSQLTFPVVVKGKYYDAEIAYNVEQAKQIFLKTSAKWGLPIIVQQYINGTEYNVAGLGDGNGNTIAALPMRKQYITDKGKAWAGISINEPNMLELTNKFVSSTKWRGAFELELMKSKDNKWYILEINPRIPAWVYLAVACGQNIPEAVALLAMNEKVTPFPKHKVGKLFIRYSYDLIVDISEFEKISTLGEL